MHKSALRLIRPTGLGPLRARFSTSTIRRNGPQYQPPTPPQSSPPASNPHRDFYKSFGRPTAKVFLMAWATYQILYWSWSKLEFIEEKEEKEEELKRLELDLQAALKEQEQTATASTSAAGVHPLDPLADQASSTKSGSWWKFF